MNIVISNHKGGVGKSTLATNLAASYAAEQDVLLIDHDTSHTSKNFHTRRGYHTGLNLFSIAIPTSFEDMTDMLEVGKHEINVVDLGGFNDDLAKAALVYADIIIVPTSTTTQDMDGNLHFMNTMKKLKAVGMSSRVVFVANNVNPRLKRDTIDRELDYILDAGYDIVGVLPHYALFSDSHGAGMSVIEMDSESKAAAAMLQLIKDIDKEL